MGIVDRKIIVLSILVGAILFIFLWLINFLNISYPISVTNRTVSGELSVVGTGQVEVVPNSATVSVGVTSEGATAKVVEQNISEANNAIIAAIEKVGIPKNDMKTSNFSINPSYNFVGGRSDISGYNGTATLEVKVKDTSKLPNVIVAATDAGANQVLNTSYNVENPEKYQEEARNKAIANAKEQAQKLASQLGIKLGKIINIAESNPETFYPQPFTKQTLDIANRGSAPPELQPGQQTITSTVTLYFEKR